MSGATYASHWGIQGEFGYAPFQSDAVVNTANATFLFEACTAGHKPDAACEHDKNIPITLNI